MADHLREHFLNIHFSSVYRTAAREYESQDDFLNACARAETVQSPQEVLTTLQAIEQTLGKAIPFRFGPRTADLDLLLYDDVIVPDHETWMNIARHSPFSTLRSPLCIPHVRMHRRRFVLEPLIELIDPHSLHPLLQKTWAELLSATKEQRCEKTSLVL